MTSKRPAAPAWLPPLLLSIALAGHGAAQSAKPDSAEAAAAMERAQRLASSPMRVILQAGKFGRKPVGGEPIVEARSEVRPEPRPEPRASVPAAAAPIVEPAEGRLSSRSPLAMATSAAVAVPALQLDRAASLAGVDAEPTLAPVPMAALAATAAVAAPAAAPMSEPRLLTMVEPAMTARLHDELGALTEVAADLQLRADGSVADVALGSALPRPLLRVVTAALLQWRFEAAPAASLRRVRLVFK